MDFYYAGLDVLRTSLLLVGSLVIFAGIVRTALETIRRGPGPHIPRRIVQHMALGLEFFVGASILNLILNPTWAVVAATALIILTRKLITLSLNRLARES